MIKPALVLLLTCAPGYADAVSYAALGRVFTASMTGNTGLPGLALVEADGGIRTARALVAFVAGAALGAWLGHRSDAGPSDGRAACQAVAGAAVSSA